MSEFIEINKDNCILSEDELTEISFALGHIIGALYLSSSQKSAENALPRHRKIISKINKLNELAKEGQNK